MKKIEHEPGMLRDISFTARSKHIGFDPFERRHRKTAAFCVQTFGGYIGGFLAESAF